MLEKKVILTKKIKYMYIYIVNMIYNLIRGIKLKENELYIYISRKNLIYTIIFLKYNTITSLQNLVDIVVIDNYYLAVKRFEITYIFWNMVYEYRMGIKLFTDGLNFVYSINSFYKSAIWLEREIWDMYGIKFLFNYELRRILTDYGFKGYPLRKDFPLIGYIDIYYDDSIQAIKYNPIELAQNLRFYKFENPWNKWFI